MWYSNIHHPLINPCKVGSPSFGGEYLFRVYLKNDAFSPFLDMFNGVGVPCLPFALMAMRRGPEPVSEEDYRST